jgi:hypothetical protein
MGLNKPVDFPTAKLLKEKGFDVPVRSYHLEGKYSDFVHEGFEDDYWGDNKIVNWNKDNIGIKPFKGFVSAPTIAEVVMWLYEKHGIWIWVSAKTLDDGSNNTIFVSCGRYVPTRKKNGFEIDPVIYRPKDNPTEAYEAGIEYVLKNLI